MVNRRVRYYVNFEAIDGFNDDDEQCLEAEGNLLSIVHRVVSQDESNYPVSEVLIEDLESHDIKTIDYRQLISFVD